MRNVKRTLSLVLIGAMLFGGTAQASIQLSQPQEVEMNAENTKSENPNIVYHWCTFWADAEDSCIENGFSYLMKDQDGEVYVFDKEYSYQDCSKTKMLVVTKYNNKNVIQAYEITPYGLVNEMKMNYDNTISPLHIGGSK